MNVTMASLDAMRFSVIDSRTGNPYGGLEAIPGNHPALLKFVPEKGTIYNLPLHGSMQWPQEGVKILRVQ